MTDICNDDHVIEIGPGKGHITKILLKCCKKLTAVELDKALYDKLQAKFCESENLNLHHQDFMRWALPPQGEYKIFANIPFCHTTDILLKLIESKNPPQDAWLIMEKGAAKRFMGIPRENARSLTLKPMYNMRIMYHFRREDFHPMPGVDVVMVHIKKKMQPDIPASQWRAYQKFIAWGTANSNSGLLRIFTKRQLSAACRTAGLSDLVSAEILYIQWLCLFRCYQKY